MCIHIFVGLCDVDVPARPENLHRPAHIHIYSHKNNQSNSPPQVEPGKKVAAIVQVADAGFRAQLEGELDILALLGRCVRVYIHIYVCVYTLNPRTPKPTHAHHHIHPHSKNIAGSTRASWAWRASRSTSPSSTAVRVDACIYILDGFGSEEALEHTGPHHKQINLLIRMCPYQPHHQQQHHQPINGPTHNPLTNTLINNATINQ
jgi:hypothetical protein